MMKEAFHDTFWGNAANALKTKSCMYLPAVVWKTGHQLLQDRTNANKIE